MFHELTETSGNDMRIILALFVFFFRIFAPNFALSHIYML